MRHHFKQDFFVIYSCRMTYKNRDFSLNPGIPEKFLFRIFVLEYFKIHKIVT